MADNDMTTVQIDRDTLEILRGIAQSEDRSIRAQLRWMVRQEYERRAQMALPLATSTPVEQNQMAMPLESK